MEYKCSKEEMLNSIKIFVDNPPMHLEIEDWHVIFNRLFSDNRVESNE